MTVGSRAVSLEQSVKVTAGLEENSSLGLRAPYHLDNSDSLEAVAEGV